MGSILELTTDLRSLRSQTYTGRKPYVSTTLPADFNSPPPKTPNTLELAAEARKDDASRLVQLLKDRPGLNYLAKQGLLSFAESGKIGKALKDVAATAATLITQATLSGTGFHGSVDIITGNTYLPVNTTANRKTIITDNKFNGEEILKGIPSGVVTNKGQSTMPLGASVDVGYKFGNIDNQKSYNGYLLDYSGNSQQLIVGNSIPDPYDGKNTIEGVALKKGPTSLKNPNNFGTKESLGRTASIVSRAKEKAKTYLDNSKEIKFKMGQIKGRGYASTSDTIDQVNYINIVTEELKGKNDLIDFKIAVYEPGKAEVYLYFRAYLESFNDNYSGEWNGTSYIGRAENIYNYTGFKRDIGFAFKIAATSQLEVLPLYQKLNRLVGTTAPSYSSTFMRGVFVKVTVGDYLKDVPGFFSSVNLTWDKSYPWEINEPALFETPSVPHLLDVNISFTPIHDFTPEIRKHFITDQATMAKVPVGVPRSIPPPPVTTSTPLQLSQEIAIEDPLTFFDYTLESDLIDNELAEAIKLDRVREMQRDVLEIQRTRVREEGGAFGRTSGVFAPTLDANTPLNITASPSELDELQERREFNKKVSFRDAGL